MERKRITFTRKETDTMSEEKKEFVKHEAPRPEFPKRAITTGWKCPTEIRSCTSGTSAACSYLPTYTQDSWRDRLGDENVIFVSGTDCYGSPIAESYRKLVAEQGFKGTIHDFVEENHKAQKKTLDDYMISLNIFGASGLGRTAEIHNKVSDWFIRTLYKNGHLHRISTKQFYDEKAGCFLNGRQVIGKCPVDGCQSEKAYADECDLGHQYMPENLINPKSTLTGDTPIMKDVENWYFDLPAYNKLLKEYVAKISRQKNVRQLVSSTISEFLADPVVHIKNELLDSYNAVKDQLPEHEFIEEKKKPSFTIKFKELDERTRLPRYSPRTEYATAPVKPLFRSDLQATSSGAFPLRCLRARIR